MLKAFTSAFDPERTSTRLARGGKSKSSFGVMNASGVTRNSRLAEQRRAAQEREAAEQARHEAELAARAAQAKNRREFFQRQQEREQRRDITALRSRVAQQASWQRDVDQAARNAVSQQQRRASFQRQQQIIDDLERSINPPPLTESLNQQLQAEEGSGWIGDPDFNPKLMVPQFIAMTPPKIEKAVEKAIKKTK